ncbi:MAG: AMP-binding protein [Syntrophomonadaceae bacterium]|nr:AMP-binding protein [Syntrophomonadaceae bacterium]
MVTQPIFPSRGAVLGGRFCCIFVGHFCCILFYRLQPLYRKLYDNSLRLRERKAIVYYGTIITWDEVRDLIYRAAGSLQRMGIGKGDRVYLGMQNCPQMVISFFAAHFVGAVVTAMTPAYKVGEVQYAANDSGAKVMIIEESVIPIYNQVKDKLSTVEHVVVTSLGEYLPENPYPHFPEDLLPQGLKCDGPAMSWKEFVGGEPLKEMAKSNINDVAVLQYTTGTTGRPKGAMLTHRCIEAGSFILTGHTGNTVDTVTLAVLPLFHITSMNDHMFTWAFMGGCLVILARFDPDSYLQAIERYRCTYSIVVTTIVIALANHPNFEKYDLSSLALLGIGGAPLPVPVLQKYHNMGVYLSEGWGMSETTALGIMNPMDAIKIGSIGMPVPQVDIRLVDPMDISRDVPIGEEGELWIKSPLVAIGYWNAPELTAETFLEGGWLRTGDICKMDEDGYFYICGRLKEMIKVSAYSVFPAEVEQYMFEHPAIQDCAAIGVPHESKGEEVKIFVVLKPDYKGKITEQEMIDWAKNQMAPYKYPRIIEFRDSLPVGNTGKVMRKILREEEAARRGV